MKLIVVITIFVISVTVNDAFRAYNETEVDLNDERAMSGYIKNVIADMAQSMKEAGYDPFYIERQEYIYQLPVPVIFKHVILIEQLLSNGISNIVVNSVNYSILASRLSFDIELPLVDMGVGSGSVETTVFGRNFTMNSSGKMAVQRMRFVGQIRFIVNLIPKINVSVRSSDIAFTMDGIESDVKLVVQNEDYSDKMNEFLSTTVPATFKEYRSEINELLGILSVQYINSYLQAQQNN
ncbi:hypothetical protein SFRURICE_021504 [Spodoptera frugiperda]|uniref:SFRICE_005536 n=1 Tax=Spodoptera frugiperda TaxID=7108 RepID=A0A2H1VAB8_SPOFR|nr:hypothetical protein SFRURICE_021504 [Spodoptera frugiperda]